MRWKKRVGRDRVEQSERRKEGKAVRQGRGGKTSRWRRGVAR